MKQKYLLKSHSYPLQHIWHENLIKISRTAMTRKNNSKIISVVHPICCGLDVDKDMVSACIIISEADGEHRFVVEAF
jgi:hypothetical protein